MDDYVLIHHGVKGMRWGVRKKRAPHDDSRKTQAIRKKHISEMSNQELRDANNRLQLERQYKDLTRRKNRAMSAAKSYIAVAGTITGVIAATATYRKLAKGALDKIGDWVLKDIKF